MKTIICDLDGTLAKDDHRNHHLQSTPRNWEDYFAACGGDRCCPAISHLLRALCGNHRIVILTGRIDKVKAETIEWLDRHSIPYDQLIMRPSDNRTDDHKWKIAMAAGIKDEVIFVLEDRQRVVDAWRKEGYVCLQVCPGDF